MKRVKAGVKSEGEATTLTPNSKVPNSKIIGTSLEKPP